MRESIDGFAIGGVVAAVHAASGEIDADVGAFEMLGPGAEVDAVPMDCLPGRGIGAAREDGDVVAAFLRNDAQESGPAGRCRRG